MVLGVTERKSMGAPRRSVVGLGELEPLIAVDNRAAMPVTPVLLRLGVEPLRMSVSLY